MISAQLQTCYGILSKFRMTFFLMICVCCSTIVYVAYFEDWKTNFFDHNEKHLNSKYDQELLWWDTLLNFSTENDFNTFVPRERKKDSQGRHYILQWRWNWGVKGEGFKEGSDFGGCVGTHDRSKLKDAEAVIFHYTALDEISMPWNYYRDPDQIFVYFNHESPSFMRRSENRQRQHFQKFDHGFINITMTYRTDSDVFSPYAIDVPWANILSEGKSRVDKLLAQKKNVALWVVSNCNLVYGSVKRMQLSDQLIKAGLPLHRYGRCFKNKQEFSKLSEEVLRSYKFYLSFENAHFCKDYITEKFWRNSLLYGRVPVVWGPSKADITRLAPTDSFIYAEDFLPASNLTSYLLYLDKNDTAYREYFKWIEEPDERTKKLATVYSKMGIKLLCDMIKAKTRKRTVVDSITNYFFNESKECFRPKD